MSQAERITREQVVTQSIVAYAKAALIARGYPTDQWRFMESFDFRRLELNLPAVIAAGFDYDDGGQQFEIGSNLKERKYTCEFYVFGQTLTWAKSMASAIKFALERDQCIPLLDLTTGEITDPPQVLELDASHSHRQQINDPEPWQNFTWYVLCQVTDFYDPATT